MGVLSTSIAVFLGIFLFVVFTTFRGFMKDDTDGDRRSGMMIYTDHKTGVQYVGTILGGLTVRVDQNGNPMIDPLILFGDPHD